MNLIKKSPKKNQIKTSLKRVKPIAGISSQYYLKRKKDLTVRHKKETFPGKTFTLATKQEKKITLLLLLD